MREKTLKYLITFHTTTGAIAMEKHCKAHGFPGRLIPVPREITAGCGMAWCAPVENRERLHTLLVRENMDWEEEYELMV